MTKYRKLFENLNAGIEKGKIPSPLSSPLDVNLTKYIFNNLVTTKTKQKTINKNVASYFQKFKFKIDYDQINYIIYP